MSQFLAVPCKKGYEIKFIENISAYVKEIYGEEQHNSHSTAFLEFGNMRLKMLSKLFDRHESTLTALTRYLDQFVALESKIPITENGVRVDFKWDDAFSKDSLFGKKGSLKIASGGYERICVLFNIAAMYSQVAETTNLSDDNGLKAAAKHLQQAAGIFSYLKSDVPNIVQREPTYDLNGDTLTALNVLMLAQAQELIYTKAVRDSHKDGNIAKITQQMSDLFADTLKLMQLNSVKSIWPKEWITTVAGKQAGYHAMAEYYQARACGANQMFGEQIARFKKSLDLMKTASTRAGPKFLFRAEQEKMKRELETVEKENNLIYHDKVPDISTLTNVSKAIVAREIPIDNPMNKDFRDLFEKIVPLAVHSAMGLLQNKRAAMTNAEIYRLKEANNTLNAIMASLNLPGALDDSSGDAVPEDLLSKAAIVRNEGGVEKIEELLNGLPDVTTRNIEVLHESIRMLDDEESSDKQLKDQFKERWNRTPSGKLTEGWRAEIQKFQVLLDQAKASDEIVRTNYKQHSAEIRMLSQNEATLKDNIPKSSTSNKGGGSSDSVKEVLRALCGEVEKLKTSRNTLIQQLTNLETNNIGTLLNKALAIDAELNQEQFMDEQLNKFLSPLRQEVRESLNIQDKLSGQLQQKSSLLNPNESSGTNRGSVISALLLAFDKFHELKSNLEEGLKFYGDLTEILLKFQNKVKDFCFARKTEKDELMKDLQTSIVREKTEANSIRTSNIKATSGGSEVSSQPPLQNETPAKPLPTYQAQNPGAGGQLQQVPGGVQPAVAATASAPPPGIPPPGGMPYPPNPYNIPQGYMPGVPYPQYPYPQPPMQHGQMPQYPPGGFNYPTGYTYPGYNQFYPR